MAARRRFPSYNPLVNPWPRVWFRGWASRAQRRHFVKDPALHRYVKGMDYWTPIRGHRAVKGKIRRLPSRLHPIRRHRRRS